MYFSFKWSQREKIFDWSNVICYTGYYFTLVSMKLDTKCIYGKLYVWCCLEIMHIFNLYFQFIIEQYSIVSLILQNPIYSFFRLIYSRLSSLKIVYDRFPYFLQIKWLKILNRFFCSWNQIKQRYTIF